MFCVDKSVTAVVIKGLADHKDELGAPLCPCRHYDDKQAEANEGFWNCPCVPMRERKVCRDKGQKLVAKVMSYPPTNTRSAIACSSLPLTMTLLGLIRASPWMSSRLGLRACDEGCFAFNSEIWRPVFLVDNKRSRFSTSCCRVTTCLLQQQQQTARSMDREIYYIRFACARLLWVVNPKRPHPFSVVLQVPAPPPHPRSRTKHVVQVSDVGAVDVNLLCSWSKLWQHPA